VVFILSFFYERIDTRAVKQPKLDVDSDWLLLKKGAVQSSATAKIIEIILQRAAVVLKRGCICISSKIEHTTRKKILLHCFEKIGWAEL